MKVTATNKNIETVGRQKNRETKMVKKGDRWKEKR